MLCKFFLYSVQKGCVLSLELFSLYTEMIIRKINQTDGVKIDGLDVNNTRPADDTVIETLLGKCSWIINFNRRATTRNITENSLDTIRS